MTEESIRSICNICSGTTEHDVLWCDRRRLGLDVEETLRLVSCRGCGDWAIRKEHKTISTNTIEVDFNPYRLWRLPPEWFHLLEARDPDLYELLREVYTAANDEQSRLLSMGVRTVLDHMMVRILGTDAGGFEAKLNNMVQQGHITAKQRDDLAIVIDAASASAHRGFRPERILLQEMLAVTESIIRSFYITGPMLETAKAHIPPRP